MSYDERESGMDFGVEGQDGKKKTSPCLVDVEFHVPVDIAPCWVWWDGDVAMSTETRPANEYAPNYACNFHVWWGEEECMHVKVFIMVCVCCVYNIQRRGEEEKMNRELYTT